MQPDSMTIRARDHVLADVALDLQERCVRLFADLHTRMEFRLGIDTGVVIGSVLWDGERGRITCGGRRCAAQWMAETSLVWRAVFRSRHRHTGVCVTATCSKCEARTTCRTWASSRPTSSRGGYEPDAHGRCASAMGTVCAAHVMQPLRHIGACASPPARGVTGAISIGVAVLLQACRPVTWRRTVSRVGAGTVPRWRCMGCRPLSSLDCWSG